MRIDRLEIENFKKYEHLVLDLHPRFTLFVGENGSGKTTTLEALAVAAGVWLIEPPDSTLQSSRREIQPAEIRLVYEEVGDRGQFRENKPVRVRATGEIRGRANVTWMRQIKRTGQRTTNVDAKEAFAIIKETYSRDAGGEKILCPVLAYYGAGRAWLPSNERAQKVKSNGHARRWAAFYDCFNERIRLVDLQGWFRRETIERGNRQGRWRPGFDIVRQAVLRCLPGVNDIRFDTDREQIVLNIDGNIQPFDNLSAGQRMTLALVADLAIKCVTQNAYLIPPDELPQDGSLPEVLKQTPGLVLIDELDVHLHPRWQRRIAKDLKETFPSIQFVCTSHSPQIIGELQPEEIRVLKGDKVYTPQRSFGIDSSRILEELMEAEARNPEIEDELKTLFHEIDQEDFVAAKRLLPDLENRIGKDDPELVRARALMDFLEADLS